MPSAREIIRGIVGALVVGFLLYSDRILSWYKDLPWQATWSGAGVSGVIAAITIYCVLRWPSKIQLHREVIRESLGDIRFALFAFVFVGVGDGFYQLDVFLSRFYLNWATWVVFGFQALLIVTIAGLQFDRLNWGARLARFGFTIVRRLIRRYRRQP